MKTASQYAKQAGLSSLLMVSDLSGQSVQTLNNWLKNKPFVFHAVIEKSSKAYKMNKLEESILNAQLIAEHEEEMKQSSNFLDNPKQQTQQRKIKMTTEQAAQKAEETYIRAIKIAEKYSYTGDDKWSFIAGYLQNSLKKAYEDAQ